MVHIKKVEIYGFKSFGYRNIVVNMEKGMVCVTGPNGSGKSNILDAIIFALGENSPRNLRVDKLHSLFHDTGAEGKVHKLVRVSVSLDNTDRGVPLDSNTVTITREMPQEGESEYLLNGKKVPKSTITDLLEVVRAAPSRLNVVQQGMIMRIAELNSEERRKIIEDIMGLSYFDKKKEEAMAQLTEADRRLEVAMARMGEIRKRIDELEEERNDQLRFEHLEQDIRRLKAIKISNSIREARERLTTQKDVLAQRQSEAEALGRELEGVKTELSKLEEERKKFLQQVDVTTKSKAEVDTSISGLIVRFEQLKASVAAAEQRLKTIGETIPAMMKEKESMKKNASEMGTGIEEINARIRAHEERRNTVSSELQKLSDQIGELVKKQAAVREEETRLEHELGGLEERKGSISLAIATNSERARITSTMLDSNAKRLEQITAERQKLQSIVARLQGLGQEEQAKITSHGETIRRLAGRKSRTEQEVETASAMLEKAGEMAARYETRIKIAKDSHSEDYAIATLLDRSKDFGILGTVQQLIGWKKDHERAVLAVAASWMKALVVKDVGKMMRILEHARESKLPLLRMIPLDVVKMMGDETSKTIPTNETGTEGAIGFLADFATSNLTQNLAKFIFSDALLVESTNAAYELSKRGYRTVTLAGELFEPKASAVVLDLNTRITDLTKTILLGESVGDLKSSLDMLRKLIAKKKEAVRNIENRIAQAEAENVEAQKSLTSVDAQIENVQVSVQRFTKTLEEISSRIASLRAEQHRIGDAIRKLEAEREEVEAEVRGIRDRIGEFGSQAIARSVDGLNMQKTEVIARLEGIEREMREEFMVLSSRKAEVDTLLKRAGDIDLEIARLKQEAKEKAETMRGSGGEMQELEARLRETRDREQQIIDTSGNSVGILQEYDSKIKVHSDNERRLSRQLASVEKDIALSTKEINDLTLSEAKLLAELSEHGYRDLQEGFSTDIAVVELVREYDSIRGSINQLADKSYVQIIDGYRGMSSRKNQLESERNSIVRFIEDIEKEKKQIFMGAFEKVDKDVRHVFSTMTGGDGSAWLEIENPDDVFASGLTLLAQFPNKPARESTALSGGEKTITATTFLLALQSLKPSPFYLFDEIDAHLDAQNTERLMKIMQEKSRGGQIITVTLKDAIVAYAQLVHGVYARNGVSQVIRYRSSTIPVAS